jgi:hypothetical protein
MHPTYFVRILKDRLTILDFHMICPFCTTLRHGAHSSEVRADGSMAARHEQHNQHEIQEVEWRTLEILKPPPSIPLPSAFTSERLIVIILVNTEDEGRDWDRWR